MSDHKISSRQYFSSLKIIYYSQIGSLIAFGAISFFITSRSENESNKVLNDVFFYLVPLLIASGFISSNLVYKNQLAKLKSNNSLSLKMSGFQKAFILRVALLEGPGLFAIVAYFITANYIFLVLAMVVIVYLFIVRPSAEAIAKDLDLNYMEKRKIENPDEIISEIE